MSVIKLVNQYSHNIHSRNTWQWTCITVVNFPWHLPGVYFFHSVLFYSITTFSSSFALSASVASRDKTPVFKVKAWRKGEQALKDVVAQYKEVGAELNVLPFCSQFIPMDVINYPKHKSICYHPSILPKHRGVSAINWLVFSTQFSCLSIASESRTFWFWRRKW